MAGAWSDGGLGFGHRRLAIIDLSIRSNQPMVDPELGLALVFNGAIYNYRELRQELAALGYHFFSDGDTEVILKAWHAWGEDCVERLHGMFAFALWDLGRRVLFLARDRFGVKPLYWTRDASRFRFASSSQALLAAGGVDTAIDPIALHHLFTLHAVVPAPRTILHGRPQAGPGPLAAPRRRRHHHRALLLEPGAASDRTPSLARGDWVAAIGAAPAPGRAPPRGGGRRAGRGAALRRAGFEPAGGPAGGAGDSGDSHLLGGFRGHPGGGRQRVRVLGPGGGALRTRHHKFQVPNAEVLRRLPEAVDAMTEPMFGQDAVAFYLLGEQVSREIKVVQSGQGADEVFGGYFWYPRMAAADRGAGWRRFRRHYFDRDHAEYLRLAAPAFAGPDHTGRLVADLLDQPGAEELVDAGPAPGRDHPHRR